MVDVKTRDSRRKTIAVCVTGYDYECEARMINGIYSACKQADINLLVFASTVRRPELNSGRVLPPNIVHGENEIFHLINYELIDGVIMLGESFLTPDVITQICGEAAKYGVPVVNMCDPAHEVDYNIFLSDSVAMEHVVRHLVEKHGLKRINFIGGFPGNIQTEERLTAYRKVLTEYGIPVEEQRIAYGEFWCKATECTKKFMEVPKEEWPQAIVCASDTMAFFCMDYLKEMGLSIPEDIIVTGFDGIRDCEFCTPKLTTVRRAFTTAGKKAVEMLQRLWAGQPVEKDVYVEAELLPSESCGCIKRIQGNENYTKRFDFQNRFMEFNAYILEMDSNFGNVDDSANLYQGTLRGADFFHLKQMFLCLCTDLENQNVMLEQLEHNSISSELTEQMVSMAQFGHEVPIGTLFDKKNLLPIDFLQGEKAVLYAFSPLYFKDYFLGYMAYQPSSTQGRAGDLFATWILQIANNAGSFYMQKELRYAADKLENLYERDPLTGVFNRRGLQHNKRVVAQAHQRGELVTVVAADVDNLKKVNDAYGHEGGDTIIIRSAMALTQAFPEDAVCVRTGGDEFCIYFSHDADASVEQMIQKVDHYLVDFNQHSGLPYQAGCSCGFCTGYVEDVSELDELQRIADENMYKVKLAKKAVRV